MAAGWVTIAIRKEVKNRLEKMYQTDLARPRNQKFTAWLDERLSKIISWQEAIAAYSPFVKFEGAHDNQIILFDNLKDERVNVWINSQDMRLECEADPENPLCAHVGYCFAIDDILKILTNKGFKEPKPRR